MTWRVSLYRNEDPASSYSMSVVVANYSLRGMDMELVFAEDTETEGRKVAGKISDLLGLPIVFSFSDPRDGRAFYEILVGREAPGGDPDGLKAGLVGKIKGLVQ